MKVRVERECGEKISEIHAVVLTGDYRDKNYNCLRMRSFELD